MLNYLTIGSVQDLSEWMVILVVVLKGHPSKYISNNHITQTTCQQDQWVDVGIVLFLLVLNCIVQKGLSLVNGADYKKKKLA